MSIAQVVIDRNNMLFRHLLIHVEGEASIFVGILAYVSRFEKMVLCTAREK